MKKRINICIATDEKYLELGIITLKSVVINSSPNTFFFFYIIDNGIKESSKNEVLSFFQNKNCNVFFIPARDIEQDLEMKINAGRWTLGTFQRLYISEFLPKDVDRIIYLDCDMLVRYPLDDLYSIKLEEHQIIAGVLDCISEQNKRNIKLGSNDDYINAGMLLIDVYKWRNYQVGKKSLESLRTNLDHLQYLDQDLINITLKGKIKIVSLKYNAYTAIFNYTYDELLQYRNAKKYYKEDIYMQAVLDPIIVHFTQDTISIRPWYKNGEHKYRNEWINVRKQTPWINKPLWDDSRTLSGKLKKMIFKILPRKFSVKMASIMNDINTRKYS